MEGVIELDSLLGLLDCWDSTFFTSGIGDEKARNPGKGKHCHLLFLRIGEDLNVIHHDIQL